MSSLLESPTKPSSSDDNGKQWVVTELYYPTSYGCHRGKRWSEDEFIQYSQFEIVDGPFSDKQEAIQAAISQRNNNDWFGEDESEMDETFGKLPPFDSADLENYDNDDEYLIQVMTQKDFEAKVEENTQTVQSVHKKKKAKLESREEIFFQLAIASGRCHYHYPPIFGKDESGNRIRINDIKCELEMTEPKKPEVKKKENDGKKSTSTGSTTSESSNNDDNNDPIFSMLNEYTKEQLSSIKSLRYAIRSGWQLLPSPDKDPLLLLLSQCTQLEELHLDAGVDGRHLGRFETLLIGSNKDNYTDENYILKYAPHLAKTLKVISFCSGDIDPETIRRIGDFTNLERLDLGSTFNIANGFQPSDPWMSDEEDEPHPYDEELLECVMKCSKLKRVDIRYDDEGMRYVFDYCLSRKVCAMVGSILANQSGALVISDTRLPYPTS